MAEATRSSIHWLVLAALCLSARTAVPAQSGPAQSPPQHSVEIQSPQSGSLAGRLTDLHSAPLAGVTLVLRNQATGAEVRTSTSKNGVFRFPSLDAASYTLEADAANLGQGRLEGIVVTGGTESRVQAAMAFDPAPPVLLQASAPPQISVPPITAAIMPRTAIPPAAIPRLAIPTISASQSTPSSLASVPALLFRAPSFATSAQTVAPTPPSALPRPVLNTISPLLIASVNEKPLNLLPLKISTGEIASKPSAPLVAPAQTSPQFAPQLEASTQIAPPVAAPSAFATTVTAPPVTNQPSAPITTPTSPTVAALPSAPTAPTATSAPQQVQLQPRRIAPPLRPALETQSAAMLLALSITPQRPFELEAATTSVLAATATLPPSIVQAALLNPELLNPALLNPALLNPALLHPLPVAATIAAAQPPDPVTPAVTTTITAVQLQALPASGRRWQDFLLDTPAANVSTDSSSQLSFRGSQQSAEVTVDGANIGVAFGVFAGSGMRASDSTGENSDLQKSASQSGSQSWTGGRGLAISEAAIREVTTTAGNVKAEGMRSAGGAHHHSHRKRQQRSARPGLSL
ncbi:MAG: carboxypeptidase regulatory-like domain-containing protein [Terracidiphilus sp.]